MSAFSSFYHRNGTMNSVVEHYSTQTLSGDICQKIWWTVVIWWHFDSFEIPIGSDRSSSTHPFFLFYAYLWNINVAWHPMLLIYESNPILWVHPIVQSFAIPLTISTINTVLVYSITPNRPYPIKGDEQWWNRKERNTSNLEQRWKASLKSLNLSLNNATYPSRKFPTTQILFSLPGNSK